jgi:hypothetical protein
MYPDAVLATAEDAGHLGLNAISDGYHVVLPADSANFADRLLDRGYEPIPVDLSEFRASGGGQMLHAGIASSGPDAARLTDDRAASVVRANGEARHSGYSRLRFPRGPPRSRDTAPTRRSP